MPSARARPGLRTQRASTAHQAGEASRDEECDVGEGARQRESIRDRQISRFPHRRELLLVSAEPLEVVKSFAMREQQRADAAPERRTSPAIESRQWGHAEVEPAIPFLRA